MKKPIVIALTLLLYVSMGGLLLCLPFRRLRTSWVSFISRRLLAAIDLRLKVIGQIPKGRNFLIVSNHSTYIDMPILAAHFPSLFITAIETQSSWFEGILSRIAGCLFINRKSKANLPVEISQVTTALARGENVILFPEAGYSDGSQLLKFRKPFFQAAINAKKNILPACIQYLSFDGTPLCPANKHLLLHHEPISTLQHIGRLLKLSRIEAELRIFDSVEVTEHSTAPDLCEQTFAQIAKAFRPIE